MEVLRPGGQYIAYGSSSTPLNLPFPVLLAKNIQLKFFTVYHLAESDRTRAQAVLQRMLVRGGLVRNVLQRLPLENIMQSHELVEQGWASGNVVLSID